MAVVGNIEDDAFTPNGDENRGGHRRQVGLGGGLKLGSREMNPAVVVLLLLFAPASAQTPELSIHLVGNAGVVLSDGTTSLLVDLPYEPGAFGYMRYDPGALRPAGATVSVITHDHRDHFDPGLFLARAGWRIIGPSSVTAGLPSDRVLTGDSVTVGAFSVVAIPTPHTDDHRSYRIRWRGRVLHFTGDTEEAAAVPTEPRLDILFITPWLNCSLARRRPSWNRAVLYHRRPDGSDRVCGAAEVHAQGSTLLLTANGGPNDADTAPSLGGAARHDRRDVRARHDGRAKDRGDRGD